MTMRSTRAEDWEGGMNEAPEPGTEPANLRFLRRLVTVLTATMIVGLCIIVALFVIRFRPGAMPEVPPAPALALPESLSLPAGERAAAFTQAETWYAVVTDRGRILVYDRATGVLRQTVQIEP